jgi:DNA-binding transcriptional LysR family regulator
MEFTQLRSLLAVAEAGSITGAALEVGLTQPAVTQQMKALERETGTPLLDRTGSGVHLTAAGETLLRYARQALSLLEEGRQAIDDLESGALGQLLLGAGVTTSIFHLPSLLRQFREAYPAVDVIVRTGRSAEIASLVLNREIDVGLVTSPVADERLRLVELYSEEIVLVAPPTQAPAKRSMHARELPGVSLILFPRDSGFRQYLDDSLSRAGITPRVKMETDSVEATKSFVAVGLGSSLLPLSAVTEEIRQGALRRVPIRGMPALRRHTSLIHRNDRHLTAPARYFVSIAAGRGSDSSEGETRD